MKRLFWTKKSATLRLTFFFIGLVILSFASIFITNTSQAASLKPVSVINSDSIKLGDIFDNVGKNADYVVGAAPQPGTDMTLNARTLFRIASALDLKWRPTNSSDQVIIRRDATVVSYDKIETSLRNSLKDKGVHGRFDLTLNSGKPSIVLPNDIGENVEVSSIKYDRTRDYFNATLVAPSAENPIKKVNVTGVINRLTMVPVLMSNLQAGDIISEADINMVEISQKDIQHNMITKKENMIGLTPRRAAYAGKYLPQGSLIKPQLVKRGESVSITFREGPLVLSAKGKALSSGAIGDRVRVSNANSSRIVDAEITGSNQVVVR